MSIFNWKFFKLRNQFQFLGGGIEKWVMTDVFVLLICFRNVTSQVPDLGWIMNI